jgi:carbonic anhydrase
LLFYKCQQVVIIKSILCFHLLNVIRLNKPNQREIEEMRKLLALLGFVAISSTASFAGAHWGYTGKVAPEHWGDLAPEYRVCKEGKNQSPIDLNPEVMVKACLEPLKVNYSEGQNRFLTTATRLRLRLRGITS